MRPTPTLFRALGRASRPRPAGLPLPFHSTPRTSMAVCARLHPVPASVRFESSRTPAATAAQPQFTTAPDSRLDRDQVPSYELTFTCKVCSTRSSHRLSKQGYHHGTILISCPGCKNRHLISDHLKIFSDKSVTLEDLMQEKGNLVKKGALGAEGDIEFWDDGSTSPRSANFVPVSNEHDQGKGRLTDSSGSSATVDHEIGSSKSTTKS